MRVGATLLPQHRAHCCMFWGVTLANLRLQHPNQDFRFAILADIDYTSNCLFWSRFSHFSIPSDFSGLRETPALGSSGHSITGSASFQGSSRVPIMYPPSSHPAVF